ncbi:MAG: SEL1-like repeat protein, partial [Victivallaceae bacterium]
TMKYILLIINIFLSLSIFANDPDRQNIKNQFTFECAVDAYKTGSFERSKKLFEECSNSISTANFYLGVLSEKGWGTTKDYKKAFEYYSKLASLQTIGIKISYNGRTTETESPVALSKNNLGVLYLKGLGVPQDINKGIELLKDAADLGNIYKAQMALGAIYSSNDYVSFDFELAKKYYEKASNHNNHAGEADLCLGVLFFEKKINAEAEKWFKKAIDKGNNLAKNNLAFLYATERRNLQESEILMKQLTQEDQCNDTYWDTYGFIFYQQQKYSEAKNAFAKALSISPKNLDSLVNIGETCIKLEQNKEAIIFFTKAIDATSNKAEQEKLKKKIEKLQLTSPKEASSGKNDGTVTKI